MEKETGYIENLIKKISADKCRMCGLIFGALSAICTIIYMVSVSTSGLHLLFTLTILAASVVNVLYTADADAKIKIRNDVLVWGAGAVLLGMVLKVVQVGLAFSVRYFVGYLTYAIAFLLIGVHFAKNESKSKLIQTLLIICAAWAIFEFFYLHNAFVSGITWKIFRFAEAFLAISYLCVLKITAKSEEAFAEKVGSYKRQIPSLKICIAIVLVIAVLSGAVGFVLDMGKGGTVTTSNATNTVTESTAKTEKKSTVTSTVVPAETTPKEPEEIKIGDSVETDDFTFKLNKVELSRRVEPDNPPSYYTYYEAENDHVYIYVNASVTNKQKHSLECDEIYSVTADFDGGYEYKGFNIADDNDGDFTYANITSVEPLETLGVHCLVDCPEQVEDEGKPLFITITLKNGSKYKYIIK